MQLDLGTDEWAIDHPSAPPIRNVTAAHKAFDSREVTIDSGFPVF
jgi:hypothetical protein